MKPFVLALALCSPAGAQRVISAGVVGGVPFNDYLTAEGDYSSKTNRYTAGPAVEVRLPFRLGVEFNALYKRLHYSYHYFSGSVSGTSFDIHGKTTAARWELPLMLKYRLPSRAFLSAGAALGRVSSADNTENACFKGFFDTGWSCRERSEPQSALRRRTVGGFVAGGGVEIAMPVVRLVPSFRYTRWSGRNFETDSELASNRHQAEFLLGVMF